MPGGRCRVPAVLGPSAYGDLDHQGLGRARESVHVRAEQMLRGSYLLFRHENQAPERHTRLPRLPSKVCGRAGFRILPAALDLMSGVWGFRVISTNTDHNLTGRPRPTPPVWPAREAF